MIQESPRYCGECPDYLFVNQTRGLCDRFEDPNFVFFASPENPICLYKSPPPQRLSEQEIKEKRAQQFQQQREFDEHCERASKIVSSWPEWKRNLLGSMKAKV